MTDNIINAGRQPAVCRSIQFSKTDKAEKPQVVICFEILGEGNPDAGRFITYFGGLDEAANGKTKGPIDFTIPALRACGWTGDDLSELPDLASSDQLSSAVELVIAHEDYEGNTQAKIKFVNRPGGQGVQLKKPMSEHEIKQLAAQMKSRLRADAPAAAKKPNGAGGAPKQSQHPNAPGNLDDIPFATCDIGDEPSPIARLLR